MTAIQKANKRLDEAEDKRISVDISAEYLEVITEEARQNERTIPAQIRLIVRDWIASKADRQENNLA
jgi:hypothetical protein